MLLLQLHWRLVLSTTRMKLSPNSLMSVFLTPSSHCSNATLFKIAATSDPLSLLVTLPYLVSFLATVTTSLFFFFFWSIFHPHRHRNWFFYKPHEIRDFTYYDTAIFPVPRTKPHTWLERNKYLWKTKEKRIFLTIKVWSRLQSVMIGSVVCQSYDLYTFLCIMDQMRLAGERRQERLQMCSWGRGLKPEWKSLTFPNIPKRDW